MDKLKTIPETNADNPLWLGLALHKGIELSSVEAGIQEYKSHFNVITDENINWIMQLEYQLPRVFDILPPGGEHEIEMLTDDFVGYADYLVGDTLVDFKFSNNQENYLKSPQLSIYKHYLEMLRPGLKINHLKYLFVPKVQIRQKFKAKPPETIVEFRTRLLEHLKYTEVQLVEVPYDEASVTCFHECCKFIGSCKDFPKKESGLCRFCPFQRFCQNGEDWMILPKKE